MATALSPPIRALGWWHRQLLPHSLLTPAATGVAVFCLYASAAWISGERPVPWDQAGVLGVGFTLAAGLRALIIKWRHPRTE
ncbi:hypothetical protein ACIBEJ_11190 [Nonomuraea sp. NPDC050790]|uniref:hypothetical protein n=1 Tax=Nonomuraea sp. NPDC050790 TaxID=3364371 RepID=UPI00378FC50C